MSQLTAQDEQAALVIGVLMFVAKMSQQYRAASMLNRNPEAAAERLSNDVISLMQVTMKAWPAGDMEKQVLEVARRIGFEVEQHYIGKVSRIPQ